MKGPEAIHIENCDDPVSDFTIATGDGSNGGSYKGLSGKDPYSMLLGLTQRISVAKNDPPPPFLPLSAIIAPGKSPRPPAPRFPLRILRPGSKRRVTRTPEPIMREVSRCNEASLSLALVSESMVIRPTTTTSSCTNIKRCKRWGM